MTATLEQRSPVAATTSTSGVGVGIALVLVGLNLRPAVTSVGSVLGQIQSTTGMSTTVASLVVATPVVCFALGGRLAWTLRRRWGASRSVTVALGVLAASLACRSAVGATVLWLGTVTACLGIAVLATLLPAIVQGESEHQRHRLNTCWTSALGAGSAVGALITPRVADVTTWQAAASSWGAVTVVTLVAWLLSPRRHEDDRPRAAGDELKSGLGPWSLCPRWPVVALSVHFGLLTGASFTLMGWLVPILVEWAGVPRLEASWMFGAAMTIGVFLAPWAANTARHSAQPNQSALVGLLSGWTIAGTVGLWLWPQGPPLVGTWLWAGLIGLGTPSVVLAVLLIGLRTRDGDRDSIAALSSVVNATGFGLAGCVALIVGLVHAATNSWAWALGALLVVLGGQAITGMIAGRAVTVALEGPATSERDQR